MSTATIYLSNDNLVEWSFMDQASDGSYVNDATVTMTLKLAGSPVSGATAVALTYVSGSNGRYQGVIPSSVSLTAGGNYTLEITAVSGTKDGFVTLDIDAVNRVS